MNFICEIVFFFERKFRRFLCEQLARFILIGQTTTPMRSFEYFVCQYEARESFCSFEATK